MKGMMKTLKWIRIVLAALSLAGMSLLLAVPGVMCAAELGWLARVQLVPALMAGEAIVLGAILLSVLLCGRVYCAVVCPLGIAQDVARAILKVLRLGRPVSKAPANSRAVRIAVLVLFAVGAVFGFTGLIAPYGMFGRFVKVGILRVGEPSLALVAWSLLPVVAILALTALEARWWCNQVCPVGTLLGFLSRFAFFRVRIDAGKCVKCGLCARACEKGVFAQGRDRTITVDGTKCVCCLACAGACRKGALTWR